MHDTAKTNESYWSEVWSGHALPPPLDLKSADYLTKKYHEVFERNLPKSNGQLELLELGCASSTWLPHLAKHFRFRVSGIDYSEPGCRVSREILKRDGVPGFVVHGDAFNPTPDFENRFDVVVSMGLVEHFRDTAVSLRSFSRFVKPGGLLITTVPNMAGWVGTAQKLLNRSVYEGHEPLDLKRLEAAHRDAGLATVSAGPVGILDFHVVSRGVDQDRGDEKRTARWLAHKILMRLSRFIWKIDSVIKLPMSPRTAAALYYVARKPA